MRVRALHAFVAVVVLALTHCAGSAQSREPSAQAQSDLKALARQSLESRIVQLISTRVNARAAR